MKFLHLADLHLGKVLLEQSLIEDQEYMINKIIELVKMENIDAVLISGDVYDKNVPSLEAVNLLDEFLRILIKELKVKVFIISGNHDSKDRLGFGNKIFENEGLYIESKYEGSLRKISLDDEYGKINIYMLPFIKPVEVKKYLNFEDGENSTNLTYDEAVRKIIEKEKIDESKRNIILVHQFVTAGTVSPERTDSEIISLGGIDNVDVSNFDQFDYVAIGHVHRPQRIGRETARYAGTMLKYSFSEINHNKTFAIIEFKEKDNLTMDFKEIKPLRDLREIKGPIEELLNEENYKDTNLDDYIKATVTNEEPIYDAIGQIRKVYPNTLKLEIINNKTIQNLNKDNSKNIENLRQKTELELFDNFYEMQNNKKLNENQKSIIEEILKGVKDEAN